MTNVSVRESIEVMNTNPRGTGKFMSNNKLHLVLKKIQRGITVPREKT